MTLPLFRNRKHRAYFELLDAFRREGCPLCHILSTKERELAGNFVMGACRGERKIISLLQLCPPHRTKSKEILSSRDARVELLKKMAREELRKIASSEKRPAFRWTKWLRTSSARCLVCWKLRLEEAELIKAMLYFLGEMDFWKELQRGPLLCLDHLERCLAIADGSEGLLRLLRDQTSKLNELVDDMVRFEATGKNGDCRGKALEWLADSKEASVSAPLAEMAAEQEEILMDLWSDPHRKNAVGGQRHEAEELLFENQKLRRRVQGLTERLGRAEGRAASLHYRVAELSEINKTLEMNLTGADALANGLEKRLQALKEEIRELKGAPQTLRKGD